MKFSFLLIGLFYIITLSYSQSVRYDQYISREGYVGNDTIFSTGMKKIGFNLEVDNGYANIMILPVEEYKKFSAGENYTKYVFTSEFPFNKIHRETKFVNIDRDFYVLISNGHSNREIYLYGEVSVSTMPVIHEPHIYPSNILFVFISLPFLGLCVLAVGLQIRDSLMDREMKKNTTISEEI